MTDYRQPPTREDLGIIYDLPDEENKWCPWCKTYYFEDEQEKHNHEDTA